MKRSEKYLLLLLFIYLILLFLKKSGVYIFFISDYLADLIAIPFSLGCADGFMKKYSSKKFEIGFLPMLVAVIYFSLVFEFWMPQVSPLYTSDWVDVGCYFIGGIIYLLLKRKTKAPTQTV